MTFDARRIPMKLIPGSAKSGDTNAMAIAFYPKTKAQSDRLWRELMGMRDKGLFKIEVAKPRHGSNRPEADSPKTETDPRSSSEAVAHQPSGSSSAKRGSPPTESPKRADHEAARSPAPAGQSSAGGGSYATGSSRPEVGSAQNAANG